MPLRVHSIGMGMWTAHLVEYDGGILLVDAGMPGVEGAVLRRMRRIGRDDLVMVLDFPGVINSPKSWQREVQVKPGKTLNVRGTTKAQGVRPTQAGTFTFVGSTRWHGESARKEVRVKIED